jgi:hypothetical protein
VKRGRRFYDETVPAEARIIRQNFADPPHPGDEELPEGEDMPPEFRAQVRPPEGSKGGRTVFRSVMQII